VQKLKIMMYFLKRYYSSFFCRLFLNQHEHNVVSNQLGISKELAHQTFSFNWENELDTALGFPSYFNISTKFQSRPHRDISFYYLFLLPLTFFILFLYFSFFFYYSAAVTAHRRIFHFARAFSCSSNDDAGGVQFIRQNPILSTRGNVHNQKD